LIPLFTSYFMRLHLLLLLLALAAGLPGRTALAQVVAPSRGGEVGAVRITATTMELTFGTTGTGQGRVLAIAVAPGGMPVALAAVDGKFYNGSPVYAQGDALGDGYAIYSGADTTITVTGLQPRTSYYLTDAEYNTDGTTIVYNVHGTSTVLTTSAAPITPSFSPAPLPVELTSFTGTVNAQSLATLHWATASERSADYFALERSADGTTFTETGRVAATNNSNQLLAYHWADPQRLVRHTYYRLRQVDHDGTVHYSNVATLSPASPMARLVEVYPNPSAGQTINLLLQGYDGEILTLRLSDTLGRPVLAQTLSPADAQYVAPLELPQGMASGTYILTLAGSGSQVQKRIVMSN
jgi:FlaG/FlaF family flagellin (archaellin)